jgi:type I restriction enzyme M protein
VATKKKGDEPSVGSDLVTIGAGFLEDYITKQPVPDKPEERVRQVYLRRLVEEYNYPPAHIATEFPIQKGSKLIGPADIAVFHSDVHDLANIYILVENKREERTDGLEQLQSYLSPTKASFGVWYNGRATDWMRSLDEPPYFRPIPDIPKFEQSLEDVGRYQKADLEPATELKSIFESIHNYIYANQGLLKDQTFKEILKLLFIKLVDEKSSAQESEFRITDAELEKVRDKKSSGFAGRINKLFERVKREYKDVFSAGDELDLREDCLAYAVSNLQKYSLSRTEADVKGTAFQTFVGAYQRGDRGEFFTPAPVLKLAVAFLNPGDDEFLIDPACGSGGFLVEGLRSVTSALESARPDMSEGARKDAVLRYARTYIRGIDFNPDLAKVAKMYMVLYDDGHTGIFNADSLASFDDLDRASRNAGAGELHEEMFDVLITNPPFGTKGKVTNKAQLQQFLLGREWKKENGRTVVGNKLRASGQTPEILFIERCVQLLKPGGRLAIVLPDGILTNPSLRYVRDHLLDLTDLLACVSLPDGTFRQAGVNPKTSIIFALKKGGPQQPPPEVFMCELDALGFDLVKKTAPLIFKRNDAGEPVRDENAEPLLDSEVPDAIEAFRAFKKQHGMSF